MATSRRQPLTEADLLKIREQWGDDRVVNTLLWEIARLRKSVRMLFARTIELHGYVPGRSSFRIIGQSTDSLRLNLRSMTTWSSSRQSTILFTQIANENSSGKRGRRAVNTPTANAGRPGANTSRIRRSGTGGLATFAYCPNCVEILYSRHGPSSLSPCVRRC